MTAIKIRSSVPTAAIGVRWVVEARGIRVIDELARCTQVLQYPEAGVWELLMRGHSLQQTSSMISHIAALSSEQADALVEQCVGAWRKAGWLAECDDNRP